MDTKSYLKRIGYHGSLEPNAETLRALQLAHLRAVPFENLSIHAGEPIVLNEEALFSKIVARRRGGFCYEVNGLFATLLRELGFQVNMLSAEVAMSTGGFCAPFDHMTLLVTTPFEPTRWLADVGFGDSFLEPLLLDERGVQVQGKRAYRIVREDTYFILSQRLEGEEWKPQYRFDLQPHEFADYEQRCHYQQTSPESHFTQGRICTRVTDSGRITLSELRFITTSNDGTRQERNLASDEEIAAVLSERFGVVMTA